MGGWIIHVMPADSLGLLSQVSNWGLPVGEPFRYVSLPGRTQLARQLLLKLCSFFELLQSLEDGVDVQPSPQDGPVVMVFVFQDDLGFCRADIFGLFFQVIAQQDEILADLL